MYRDEKDFRKESNNQLFGFDGDVEPRALKGSGDTIAAPALGRPINGELASIAELATGGRGGRGRQETRENYVDASGVVTVTAARLSLLASGSPAARQSLQPTRTR